MDKVVIPSDGFKKIKLSIKRVGRLNFLMAFIGHNRTGKTSIALDIAKKWKASRPEGSNTVICFDPQHKFDEVMDFEIELADTNWAYNLLKFRNSLVILDDYRILNSKNIPDKGVLELLQFRNEYNIDMIIICHNPALLINIFTYFVTHYYIFYTMVQVGSFEKKIPNYELCMAASNLVNTYVQAHGRGDYADGKMLFPYVVVENETEVVTAYNMTKDISGILKTEESND